MEIELYGIEGIRGLKIYTCTFIGLLNMYTEEGPISSIEDNQFRSKERDKLSLGQRSTNDRNMVNFSRDIQGENHSITQARAGYEEKKLGWQRKYLGRDLVSASRVIQLNSLAKRRPTNRPIV